ncbi:MAG TPA: lamin tail domain-containing protein, partial [Balneolaceae bacterium]|nr:lamin tail domain-containing protein [Balneolaceae bacterium]
ILIGENVQLWAHNYLILTESSAFAHAHDNAIAYSDFPALNNSGDTIYLQNESEITIDSLHYSPNWGIANGISLERKDPLAASNDASNWKRNLGQAGNSAGAKNDNFEPDTNPPKAVFAKVLPNGQVEIQFSEFIQLTADVKFLASGHPLSVASFDSTEANVIMLESPPAKASVQATKITVLNLNDVKGNRTAESEIAIAQPLRPSDLVINEIMFNPLNDSDDNKADQSEYIELRNIRDYAVSLEGMVLHDAPDEDGNLRILEPVTTTAKWVPPKGVVLIYADEIPVFKRSKIANFFDLDIPRKQSIICVDRASLSLASAGDAIFIADSTGATIDSVFYDESWHNPNLIDNTGIALERISPAGNSNDKSNWSSSVAAKGGTPNAENSIYQVNAESARKVGISFSPNPFSPDGDGYEDNLFINYKLDQPDYLLKVQIYDRYGRFITELADGKQAGFEGTLIWDGRKSNGNRNRIGIYIVVFEAYNSATGENKAFKKTVVLARRLN